MKNKPKETESQDDWTMPLVPFAKKYYGLEKNAAYDAASKGLIPVVRIGRRIRGLPRVAERQLSEAK